tara:strand:- start:770 stop:943 length:174 start_codon:yes stop_codon:yes gene_type:complete
MMTNEKEANIANQIQVKALADRIATLEDEVEMMKQMVDIVIHHLLIREAEHQRRRDC